MNPPAPCGTQGGVWERRHARPRSLNRCPGCLSPGKLGDRVEGGVQRGEGQASCFPADSYLGLSRHAQEETEGPAQGGARRGT